MGLLDTITGALGGQGGQGDGQGAGQGGGQAGIVGAIVGMLQNQPGGIGGILQQFERSGLGGMAQSWISPGQNQPVSPGQVTDALGPGAVDDVAGRLGVGREEAAGHLSQYLPQIIDHLSPGGQAPAGAGMGALGGLLSQLTGGKA